MNKADIVNHISLVKEFCYNYNQHQLQIAEQILTALCEECVEVEIDTLFNPTNDRLLLALKGQMKGFIKIIVMDNNIIVGYNPKLFTIKNKHYFEIGDIEGVVDCVKQLLG